MACPKLYYDYSHNRQTVLKDGMYLRHASDVLRADTPKNYQNASLLL